MKCRRSHYISVPEKYFHLVMSQDGMYSYCCTVHHVYWCVDCRWDLDNQWIYGLTHGLKYTFDTPKDFSYPSRFCTCCLMSLIPYGGVEDKNHKCSAEQEYKEFKTPSMPTGCNG